MNINKLKKLEEEYKKKLENLKKEIQSDVHSNKFEDAQIKIQDYLYKKEHYDFLKKIKK